MKLSEKWLREFVSPKLTPRGLADRLTRVGLEVSAIEPPSPQLDGVVVGEVLAIAPHPAAERLTVCQVKVAARRVLTIVCGAANVSIGMRAPVAMIGTRLPTGMLVEEAEIRGVRSSGMLCSAEELGLEELSSGVMTLGPDCGVGQTLSSALALDDQVLEIDLTPNRGDCMSVLGVARELAAITGVALRAPRRRTARTTSRRRVSVKLDAAQDCPHYAGRVIEGIDVDAETPSWLSERLRRAGVRALHPVVDVTNYVMLELGQPMHAFDLQAVRGTIHVRRARAGESLVLLDGKTIEAPHKSVLITDDEGPLALAGIMGGQRAAVSSGSEVIFLESAFFRPLSISTRARALGLQTESSQRFERGVDFILQRQALERATELLLEIVGGRAGPVVEATAKRHLPKRSAIQLRAARLARVLGTPIASTEIDRNLRRLGMRVTRVAEGWRVTPPSYRFDIEREEDLIEELARLHDYERLPARLPIATVQARAWPEARLAHARWRSLLVDRGYQEVITYSFVDPRLARLFDPANEPIALSNPISADMAVMRTNLWPGLVQVLAYNQNRQQTRVRLFEAGKRFRRGTQEPRQDRMLAGLVTGPALAAHWDQAARAADFFDIKGDLQALLGLTGRPIRFSPTEHPALHPGQTAAIVQDDGRLIGIVGLLHPVAQAEISVDGAVYLFELELEPLEQIRLPTFHEVSRFPSIRRDISVVVTDKIPAQAVLDATSRVAGKLLIDLELFDQYRGKGIDSGRKSLSLGLTLQHSSRTLKDDEVEAIMARVLSTLESELGAQLRS